MKAIRKDFMKKIILGLIMMTGAMSHAFGFKFSLFNVNNAIRNYGTYRTWSNGTIAKNCNAYRFPVSNSGYSYIGDTGDGVYRIQPNSSLAAIDVYCDMTTSGGGWTVIFDPSYGAKTVSFNKTFSSFVNNPVTGISSISMNDGRNNSASL